VRETRQWFKFFPDDFLMGVAGLSEQAIGVYIKLLAVQWKCGSLPRDVAQLSKMCATDVRLLRRMLATSLKDKFIISDTSLKNGRMEEERQLAIGQSDASREHGKLGGRPKTQRVPRTKPYIDKERDKDKDKDLSSTVQKPSDHTRAVKYFCDSFEKHFKVKYDFKKSKDGALVKRLVETYGTVGFKQITDELFRSTDSFIVDTDRGIGVLSGCSNKLMQARSKVSAIERSAELDRIMAE
jgi:uncharacterized protein YdaU (DUF1376 family)